VHYWHSGWRDIHSTRIKPACRPKQVGWLTWSGVVRKGMHLLQEQPQLVAPHLFLGLSRWVKHTTWPCLITCVTCKSVHLHGRHEHGVQLVHARLVGVVDQLDVQARVSGQGHQPTPRLTGEHGIQGICGRRCDGPATRSRGNMSEMVTKSFSWISVQPVIRCKHMPAAVCAAADEGTRGS